MWWIERRASWAWMHLNRTKTNRSIHARHTLRWKSAQNCRLTCQTRQPRTTKTKERISFRTRKIKKKARRKEVNNEGIENWNYWIWIRIGMSWWRSWLYLKDAWLYKLLVVLEDVGSY